MKFIISLMIIFMIIQGLAQETFSICPEITAQRGWQQGLEDTLFITNDLRADYQLHENIMLYIKRLTDSLRRQGTELVIVPMGGRGIMLSAFFDPTQLEQKNFNLDAARQSYNNLVESLKRDTGATVINVLGDMLNSDVHAKGDLLFFKRDHHWTNAGARVTAKAVARTIQTQLPSLYSALPKINYTLEEDIARDIDSNIYMNVVKKVCGFTLPVEHHMLYKLINDINNSQSLGLFEDIAFDTVLVGTSFSTAKFNFADFLSYELQTDVLNYAVGAGHLFTSIQDYLLSDSYAKHKPKLLIWEIVDSDLQKGEVYNQDEFVNSFRQLIPSILGDCELEGTSLYSQASILNVNSLASALPNLIAPSFDIWEKGTGTEVHAGAMSPDGQSTAHQIVFKDKPRFVRYNYDARLPLAGRVFIYSSWLWSDDPEAKSVEIQVLDAPGSPNAIKFSVELTSTPTLYQFPFIFETSQEKTLLLRMFSSKNFSYFAWQSSLVEVSSKDSLQIANLSSLATNENIYAVFDISDKTLVSFQVLVHYVDGTVDIVPIERSTRVLNNGRFFLELLPSDSNITSIELLPGIQTQNQSIDIQLRICQMPDQGT